MSLIPLQPSTSGFGAIAACATQVFGTAAALPVRMLRVLLNCYTDF
jgi:hypothetical protein